MVCFVLYALLDIAKNNETSSLKCLNTTSLNLILLAILFSFVVAEEIIFKLAFILKISMALKDYINVGLYGIIYC